MHPRILDNETGEECCWIET